MLVSSRLLLDAGDIRSYRLASGQYHLRERMGSSVHYVDGRLDRSAYAEGTDSIAPMFNSMNQTIETRCCIAGGGPAGIVLGYLLARAGVDVVILEKHADF